jgi:hypothetical protein
LPVRLYLPHVLHENSTVPEEDKAPGSVRIVQSLVPAMMSSREFDLLSKLLIWECDGLIR